MQLINADPSSGKVSDDEIAPDIRDQFLWMVYAVRDEGAYVVGLDRNGFLRTTTPHEEFPTVDLTLAEYIDVSLKQSIRGDDAVTMVRDVVLWMVGGNQLRDAVRVTSVKYFEVNSQLAPLYDEIFSAMQNAGYGPDDKVRIGGDT